MLYYFLLCKILTWITKKFSTKLNLIKTYFYFSNDIFVYRRPKTMPRCGIVFCKVWKKTRNVCYRITNHNYFEGVILVLILASTICLVCFKLSDIIIVIYKSFLSQQFKDFLITIYLTKFAYLNFNDSFWIFCTVYIFIFHSNRQWRT